MPGNTPSRLALCYINHGGGFSHFRAGVSHSKVWDIEKTYWDQRSRILASDKTFIARMEQETGACIRRLEDCEVAFMQSNSLAQAWVHLEKTVRGHVEDVDDWDMAEFQAHVKLCKRAWKTFGEVFGLEEVDINEE